MASSPVMTPGILTGAGAGMGGTVGMPDLTGLGGLFGALMQGAGGVQTFGNGFVGVSLNGADAATLPEGMADALSEAGFDVSTFLATQQEGVEETVRLEDDAPSVTVKGDAETVQAFVAQVKEIYQKVILEGRLTLKSAGNRDELAAALQHLGMDAQTAMGVAERIETMMKLLEQYQDKQADMSAETAGTLVAMMLAVMGQNGEATDEGETTGFSLQITTVEQTITVASRSVIAWKSSGDITQDLLAMGASGVQHKDVPVPQHTQALEVTVIHEGETSTIAMVLPDSKAVDVPARVADVPMADTAVDGDEVTLAARAPVTVQAVKPGSVIDAPDGETYYTLKADAHGTETVEAVKPVPQGTDTAADTLADAVTKPKDAIVVKNDVTPHGEWMQHQRTDMTNTPAMPGHAAASGTGYAARYETIQAMLDKAHVGKQVAVQIQPLLEQGGGTIKLQLNPVELGKITVELNVENGKVHGAISASEHAVVEQLARELHTLRQGLADAGLKVSEQGINLMLSSNNGNGQFGQQGGHASEQARANGRKGSAGVGGVDEAGLEADGLATNLAAWVSPDRMLDVNV